MKDKTGAVLRRLVIIPFNARFSKTLPNGESDPDYNPFIKYELVEQSSLEYLIRLGVEGLKRILENDEFQQVRKKFSSSWMNVKKKTTQSLHSFQIVVLK